MIPFAVTTITVRRVAADPTRDGYDPAPAPTVTATAVRAVISSPSGMETLTAGERTTVTFTLTADPTDLRSDDTVTDDTTGETYRVEWTRQRRGLGLAHTTGRLKQVTGV